MKIALTVFSLILLTAFNNCSDGQYEFDGQATVASAAKDLETPETNDDPPANDDEHGCQKKRPVSPELCQRLPADKVCVCHIPSNPSERKKTIIISKSALDAHVELRHGGESEDYEGPCK